MPSLSLYVDTTARQLVKSFTDPTPAILPTVALGDTLTLNIIFMAQTGVSSAPYSYLNYSAITTKALLGIIAGVPNFGVFTLTDGTNVSGPIPYNDNPIDVQAQFASVASWTSTSVTGGIGGPWRIQNGVNGALPTLSGDASQLAPSSTLVITRQAVGGANTPAVQIVRLALNPIASQTTWNNAGTPTFALSGRLSPDPVTMQELAGTLLTFNLSLQIVTINGTDVETLVSTTLTMSNTISIGSAVDAINTIAAYTNITALTGTGSTDLAAIPTANSAVALLQIAEVVGAVTVGLASQYQLQAYVGAQSLPGTVLPNDYNATTNPVAWILIQ